MKPIYQIYIENIRNGNIVSEEIDALEECLKQADEKIEFLENQLAGDDNVIDSGGYYE